MFNLHTHCLPTVSGTAIVNCRPEEFFPREGEWYSVGIHPWHCAAATPETHQQLETTAHHSQVVAIGEAGLDKAVSIPLPQQEEMFICQARLAEKVGKPLIIHLVRATDELLRLHKELCPTVVWIVHGFRGKPQQAEQLLRHGFYLSLGEHFNHETAHLIPLDRLFCETDESREPIGSIARCIAEVRSISVEKLEVAVEENLRKVFPMLTFIDNKYHFSNRR